jgi:hypothetical protein
MRTQGREINWGAKLVASVRLCLVFAGDPRQPASFFEFVLKACEVILEKRDNFKIAGRIRTALASGLFRI